MFKSVKKAVSSAAKTTVAASKDAVRKASKAGSDAVMFGATAPIEYLTVKPLEAIAPKVVELAGRGKALAGQASQVRDIAQQTLAENQGLLSMIPGAAGLAGLLGGGSAMDSSGYASPASSSRAWVWILAGVAALAAIIFIIRRKRTA